MRTTLPFLIAVTVLSACGYRDREADLVVRNARIITLDSAEHVYQAMAIKDGRIIELGAEQQILNRYGARETFDAAGASIYPGFIDGHCHFLGYGLNKQKVDLIGVTGMDELMERVRSYATAHPDTGWIIGRGWDQNLWPQGLYPDKSILDREFPDRPVLLQRIDGHAALVNSAAVRAAGLDVNKPIAGGQMLTTDGTFNGILIDNAVGVFQAIFDEADEATKRKALLDAEADCFAAGLTMVCDAGLDTGSIALIRRMQQEGTLRMRIYAMVADSPEGLAHFAKVGRIDDERLKVRSVKVYADGALGSRGALLKEPYSDRARHHGLQLASREHFLEVAQWCKAHGFQMNTHCIGDSANALLLDVYGEVLGGNNDLRWRIEHAQVVSPGDRERFGRFNIIPSVQPTHATSDGPWAIERLGPGRIADAYAYEHLRGTMGLLALGTDFPVEGIAPLQTFRSAVLRTDASGKPDGGYRPEEALERMDALRGMTIWNALATFTEAELGTLEVGKRADFTVVDGDLLEAPAELLGRLRVQATFVDGERVH